MTKRVTLLLLIAALSTAAADPPSPPSPAQTPPPPSVDRLDPATMEALVADEMQLVAHGFRDEAELSIEKRLAASTDRLTAADLIEAYGVELSVIAGAAEDKAALEAARRYLLRAVTAYQQALGDDDPAVATALAAYADAERALQPDDPAAAADAAYAQAYRIRKEHFGASAPITLRTQVKIAELDALPSRTKKQPVATRPAAHKDARMAKPAKIQTPGSATPCTLETENGGMIFEGSEEGLEKLRARAEAAHIHLQSCGALLALQIPPRSNAAAMAGLINAVGSGQIEGVRIRLFGGTR